MNTNYELIISRNLWLIISAACLSVFLFVAAAHAQVPLRANGKIAFSSDRDGNLEIYVMDADGSNQTRITNNSFLDDYPTWSPDGTKIAFICERPSGGLAICLMNGDGANKTELTPVSLLGPISWSPQGDKITFDDYSGTDSNILVVNIDGSNRRNVTSGPERDFEPSWSPDGSRILFSRYITPDPRHVYGGTIMHTIRPDGGDLLELPNGYTSDGWNDDYAKWSPSGDKVVFLVNVWDFWESIYIANGDGTNRQLFDGCIWPGNCGQDRLNPSWSPDGTRIIFSTSDYFRAESEIYVKNIDGSSLVQITNTPGRNFNPSWQPLVPAANCPNSIDCPDFFVRQHYLDFLSRNPDAAGLAFWTNEIALCGPDPACLDVKRINVSAAYFLSIEFQKTGYLVYRFYKSAYGDISGTPVPIRLNEFLPDTQKIGQGVIVNQAGWETLLENNKQAFIAEFVQRSRFATVYPTSMTPDQFVDQLFFNAGVTPSAIDRADAINEFGSSTTTADLAARARAMRRVAENSTLAQQEFNRAFVLMQYFGYLRRNPNDPPEPGLNFDGYNFWLTYSAAEMVKAFITSGEYRQRFGS